MVSENIEKSVMFYADGQKYADAMEPIAKEARNRGYNVEFTDDFSRTADIGFYNNHTYNIPKINSKLSVIMHHGLDQGFGDNWSRFDIGLIPGPKKKKQWYDSSHKPNTRPNIGMFTVGWPKSDIVFYDDFKHKTEELKNNLNLSPGRTIIYAPGFENSGKMEEFINKSRAISQNLLIKHSPAATDKKLKPLYDKYCQDDDVYIIDSEQNIMNCLALADILVSDGSSVLREASFTHTIPVSVVDWPEKIGDNINPESLPSFVIRAKRIHLDSSLQNIFENHEEHLENMTKKRKNHYTNVGKASQTTMDLIDGIVEDNELVLNAVEGKTVKNITKTIFVGKMLSSRFYYTIRDGVVDNMPNKYREILEDSIIDQMIYSTDEKVKKYR